MKGISFPLKDEKTGKRLNYYREYRKSIIADFVKDAIHELCDRVQRLRKGSIDISFQNPCKANLIDDEKAEIICVLKEADLKLSRIAPEVIDLSELVAYYSYCFYKITDKQRKAYEINSLKDTEFEANLFEGRDLP